MEKFRYDFVVECRGFQDIKSCQYLALQNLSPTVKKSGLFSASNFGREYFPR